MPSAEPLPTIEELIRSYGGAVSGLYSTADLHNGSDWEHIGGPGGLLFRRLAIRDREMFRQIYFASASGDRLDEILEHRWSDVAPRVQATRGTGKAKLRRVSAAAGAGTLLGGTRIRLVAGSGQHERFYRVAVDTPVAATTLKTVVAIEAEQPGPGSDVEITAANATLLRVEDPLWDNTWIVDAIECEDGTDRERDDDVRGRVREDRKLARVGYLPQITRTMIEAGAVLVHMFASDYLGEDVDHGLNRIYVSDAGYTTTEELLRNCRLALPRCAIAGTAVQVLPLVNQPLSLTIQLNLWDSPDSFSRDTIVRTVRQVVRAYFRSPGRAFYWREDTIAGAIQGALSAVQWMIITTTLPEPTLATLFDTPPLVHFSVNEAAIKVNVNGPT